MAGKFKLGSSPLDTAMAAFASGAVVFFTFMMPAEILARIVVIGSQTGRYLFSGAAAIVTFLSVSLLLRVLTKTPVARDGEALAADPVRLRKADMHPDAPSCTPLLAGLELGVPLDEMAVDHDPTDEFELTDAERVYDEAVPPFPEFITQPVDEVVEEPCAEVIESVETEQVERPPLDIPFWLPRDVASAEAEEPQELRADEPETFKSAEQAAIESEEASSEDPIWFEPAPETDDALDELGQRVPKKQALEYDSIEEMVERFQTRVGMRSRDASAGDTDPAGEGDDALQERLRGAIRDLRKAARG